MSVISNTASRYSCILVGTALFFSTLPYTAAAFDPSQGAEPVGLPKSVRLPSTGAVTGDVPRIQFPEVTAPVALAAPEITPPPALPPVEPAIAEKAAQQIEAARIAPQENLTASTEGFIAPAPLIAPDQPSVDTAATATPAPEPLTVAPLSQLPPVPSVVAAAAPPAPLADVEMAPPVVPERLSTASKTVLGHVPSKLDTQKPGKSSRLSVSRTSPEVQPLSPSNPKIESYDSVGLSIKVRRPGLDTNYELNRAYTALMGGDTATAITTYQNVLASEPNNEDALFGLASVYHRAGDIDRARPFYGQLLRINPNHREGLNNFMALISDEAPQEALAELERLEQRNPDFSPIPAQQGLLLRKLGFKDQARDKMIRAIDLAPENLTYKYNLAVLLDDAGNYADASALYRLLIDASLNGQKIPATVEILQKRLNFIASTTPKAVAAGS